MQAYPNLPQPRQNEVFPWPLLNPGEWKRVVGFLAALLAEHQSREAVGTSPLKWGRHAALAHCHSWDTLRVEEATQVGANPRNKLFHVYVLGLREHVKYYWRRACMQTHSHLFGYSWPFYPDCLVNIHGRGVGFIQYCPMVVYLHSSSILSWCWQICRGAYFYGDISGSSRALSGRPLNHLSLRLSVEEF